MTTLSAPKPARVAVASRLLGSLKRSYSLIQALGVLAILIVVMQIANDRFLSPATFEVKSPASYVAELRERHVLVAGELEE